MFPSEEAGMELRKRHLRQRGDFVMRVNDGERGEKNEKESRSPEC